MPTSPCQRLSAAHPCAISSTSVAKTLSRLSVGGMDPRLFGGWSPILKNDRFCGAMTGPRKSSSLKLAGR